MWQLLLYSIGVLALTASATLASASPRDHHNERELSLLDILDPVTGTVNDIVSGVVSGSPSPSSTSVSPPPPPKANLGLGSINPEVLKNADLPKGIVHLGDPASPGHASLVSIDITKLKHTMGKLIDGLLGDVLQSDLSLVGNTANTLLGGLLDGTLGNTLDGILRIGNSDSGDIAGDSLIFIDLNLLDGELLKGDVEALLDGIVRIGNSAHGDAPGASLLFLDLNVLSNGLPAGGLLDSVVRIGNTLDGYQPGESLIFIDLSLLSGDLLSAMVHVGDSADNGLALVQLDSVLLHEELLTADLFTSLVQIGDATDIVTSLVHIESRVLTDALIDLANVITLGNGHHNELVLVNVDRVLLGADSLMGEIFDKVESLVQIGDLAAGKHALLHVTTALSRSLIDGSSESVKSVKNLITVGGLLETKSSLVHLHDGLFDTTSLVAANIVEKGGCIVHVGTLDATVHAVVNIAAELVHTAKHLLGGVSDLIHLGDVVDGVTSLIQVDGGLLGAGGVVGTVLDKVSSLIQIGELGVDATALIAISGAVAAELVGTVDVNVDGVVAGVVGGVLGAVNNLVHIGGLVDGVKSLVHLEGGLLSATGLLVSNVLDKVGCIVHVGTLDATVHAVVNIAAELVHTAKHLLGGVSDLIHLGDVVDGVTSLIQVDGGLLGAGGVVGTVLDKVSSLIQIGELGVDATALIAISGAVAAELVGTVDVNVGGVVGEVVGGVLGAVNNLVHIGGLVDGVKSLVHLEGGLLSSTGLLASNVLDKVGCIVHVGTLDATVHAVVNIAANLVSSAAHLLDGLNGLVKLGDNSLVGDAFIHVSSLLLSDGALAGLTGLVQLGELDAGEHSLIQIDTGVVNRALLHMLTGLSLPDIGASVDAGVVSKVTGKIFGCEVMNGHINVADITADASGVVSLNTGSLLLNADVDVVDAPTNELDAEVASADADVEVDLGLNAIDDAGERSVQPAVPTADAVRTHKSSSPSSQLLIGIIVGVALTLVIALFVVAVCACRNKWFAKFTGARSAVRKSVDDDRVRPGRPNFDFV